MGKCKGHDVDGDFGAIDNTCTTVTRWTDRFHPVTRSRQRRIDSAAIEMTAGNRTQFAGNANVSLPVGDEKRR